MGIKKLVFIFPTKKHDGISHGHDINDSWGVLVPLGRGFVITFRTVCMYVCGLLRLLTYFYLCVCLNTNDVMKRGLVT